MKKTSISRRKALASFGTIAAATPLAAQQEPKLIGEPPGRIAPRGDLVNVLEYGEVAERKLAGTVFSTIAGSDRTFFDRITFRPRMMVPTTNLDLTSELFGEKMFAPIIAGPIGHQQAFHPDGELATVRGASAAKTVMVVSSESSVPLEKIAAESKTTLWYQVFPDADMAARIQQAVKAGCKAVCITVGAPMRHATGTPSAAKLAAMKIPPIDWKAIEDVRKNAGVPVILKGIMAPEEADAAIKHGVQGLVVSNYGGLLLRGEASSMEVLPSIVDAANKRVPVFVDGNFRRGSDIFKALAFGATAVMIGRPVMWGLAAYGTEGVQGVLEMLQTELARDMCQCGKETLKAVDRSVVKLHAYA
ncbi:MAG TPA: alpha-hydroxy acid oxidase [Bryobacteraceae bacterium]|nr:alpha-hydroxy acid oxidase [Bryobacteraceae bacterium]